MSQRKVVIVGAGPVGALAALYAASRGDEVEVHELRSDLRDATTTPLNFTKSINLALSERGINALRSSGHPDLLATILSETIPMHGRMIHTRSVTGQLNSEPQLYDPVHGRYQRSVDRGGLNKCLLNELEKLTNVTIHFQHKLTGADLRSNKAWFEDTSTKPQPGQRAPEIEVTFDLLVGADGAHSAVRHHLMKYARMDYSQTYIDCLWSEFTMPPTSSNSFAISPNHLHIWPAGSSMFIALPSLDKSFICTLFGPSSLFDTLESGDQSTLLSTFEKQFPGVVPDLISPDDLYAQFRQNPHLPLINIRCSPHSYSSSAVILGDAANAMVPFYGQGMNAGLESVRVLFSHLDAHPEDRNEGLAAYTRERTADAHAIADLALGNYVEMRSSVTSRTYKLRKFVEEALDKYMPWLGWSTQYARVSFGSMRYSEVIRRTRYQKDVLERLLYVLVLVVGVVPAGVVGSYLWRNVLRRRLLRTRV